MPPTGHSAQQPKKDFPVLVIDDNPIDRELTTAYLARAWPFERGMALDYAADGREALEKIRLTRFALIVLDWKLPLLGGGEVLRSIRKSGVIVPVVVVSGLQREEIKDNLEELGAAFLNKEMMNGVTLHDAIAKSLENIGLTKPVNRAPARA